MYCATKEEFLDSSLSDQMINHDRLRPASRCLRGEDSSLNRTTHFFNL